MAYNPNVSLLPSGGGTIQAMSGGGEAPLGYNANASVISLTNNVADAPIIEMKGGAFDKDIADLGGIVKRLNDEVENALKEVTSRANSTRSIARLQIIKANIINSTVRLLTLIQPISDKSILQNTTTFPILTYLQSVPNSLQQVDYKISTYPPTSSKASAPSVDPILSESQIKALSESEYEAALQAAISKLPAEITSKVSSSNPVTIRIFKRSYLIPMNPRGTTKDELDLLRDLGAMEEVEAIKYKLLEELYKCHTDKNVIQLESCQTLRGLLFKLAMKYIKEKRKIHPTFQGDDTVEFVHFGNDTITIKLTLKESEFSKLIGSSTASSLPIAKKPFNVSFTKTEQKTIAEWSTVLDDYSYVENKNELLSIHGIGNVGNTCYCNAAIQFLFSIPEVRNQILQLECKKADLVEHSKTTIDKVDATVYQHILCAVKVLFIKLMEGAVTNIAEFPVTTTPISGNPVGYIQKIFSATREIGHRDQEDTMAYLRFLFEGFSILKLKISDVFQYSLQESIKCNKSSDFIPKGSEQKDYVLNLSITENAELNTYLTNYQKEQPYFNIAEQADERAKVDMKSDKKDGATDFYTTTKDLWEGCLSADEKRVISDRYATIYPDTSTSHPRLYTQKEIQDIQTNLFGSTKKYTVTEFSNYMLFSLQKSTKGVYNPSLLVTASNDITIESTPFHSFGAITHFGGASGGHYAYIRPVRGADNTIQHYLYYNDASVTKCDKSESAAITTSTTLTFNGIKDTMDKNSYILVYKKAIVLGGAKPLKSSKSSRTKRYRSLKRPTRKNLTSRIPKI
jgi:hypothetical protein